MNGYKKFELYQEALKFEQIEDYRDAFNSYLASAKQGYPRAQLAVAKFYLGEGLYKGIIKADRAKAIDYLEQASAGGNAEAKYRLAIILLEQKDDKSNARAFELLRDAADRKYCLAALEIAKCYFRGIGVKQSYSRTLSVIENLVYGKGVRVHVDWYDDIRTMLEEIKTLVTEQKDKLRLSGDEWCLFKDLCNDFCITD